MKEFYKLVNNKICNIIIDMEDKNLKLTIAYMYPKHLNLYGDKGNIIALKKRCEWRNIEVEINEINIGDDVTGYDIYFIGGGQDKQQEEVAKELYKNKEKLTYERDKGSVFLAICGGYQLLGHYYLSQNQKRLEGISLLDAHTIAGEKRFIGNVTVETEFLEPKTLVGFENHAGQTYINGKTIPLGKVIVGNGNNGNDRTAGARFKNVFGTYLHGSILPKNPHFTDYLIKLALEKKYNENFELKPLNDEIEILTHNSLVEKNY